MMLHSPCSRDADTTDIHASLGTGAADHAWRQRILNDLSDAATLLDCLEVWGIADRQLAVLENGSFLVQWRE